MYRGIAAALDSVLIASTISAVAHRLCRVPEEEQTALIFNGSLSRVKIGDNCERRI